MTDELVQVRRLRVEARPGRGEHETVVIRAGAPTRERIVPPAGEAYAFDAVLYPVEVQVTVSPQGRSVGVYINGEKVEIPCRS